eukprot:11316563-Ditylum_brightwellii.AAC.1
MVQTLTDAQLKSSEELKRLKEEKERMGGDWGHASVAARQQSCPAPPIAAVAEGIESHAVLDSLNGISDHSLTVAPTAVAFAPPVEQLHQYPQSPRPAVPTIELCGDYGPRPVTPVSGEVEEGRLRSSYGLRQFDEWSTHVFPSSKSIPVSPALSPAQSPTVSALKMINQDGGVSPVMSRYSHHNHKKSGDMWKDEE